MKYLLSGDLGTSGIKIGLVSEAGELVESTYQSVRYHTQGSGRVIQRVETFLDETLRLIRLIIEKSQVDPRDIVALSLSSQMGGIIGVDKTFVAITGLDMGLDLLSERYNRWFQDRYADFVNLKSCGSPRNFPKILWWKRERPEIYEQVVKFVTLNTYVVGRMAGYKNQDVFIDYTLLSFFGNEDMVKRAWSEELSQELGVSVDKLPRIVPPWTIVGKVSSEIAEKCGLLGGTPIVAGAGDQPAGFLGGGFCEFGTLVDVSGSSTLLSLYVPFPVRERDNPVVMYMPSVIPGEYHAFTYINGGGTTLNWFVEEFASGDDREEMYRELTERSEVLPLGSEGLIFLPYFGGRQCSYDDTIRGGFIGLSWWHKREHLFRSILESLAYNQALGFSALHRLFPWFSSWKVFAMGGGTRNRLWNQIKADVLNIQYIPVDDYKFPLLGNAIIAGYGIGLWDNLVPFSLRREEVYPTTFYPNRDNNRVYREFLSIYERLITSPLSKTFLLLRELSERG